MRTAANLNAGFHAISRDDCRTTVSSSKRPARARRRSEKQTGGNCWIMSKISIFSLCCYLKFLAIADATVQEGGVEWKERRKQRPPSASTPALQFSAPGDQNRLTEEEVDIASSEQFLGPDFMHSMEGDSAGDDGLSALENSFTAFGQPFSSRRDEDNLQQQLLPRPRPTSDYFSYNQIKDATTRENANASPAQAAVAIGQPLSFGAVDDDVIHRDREMQEALDDRIYTFFCGESWADASSKCQVWCPDADDTICGYGQSCFSDTTCKYTEPPTPSPTPPPPTRSPTPRPSDPTFSPTGELLPDSPTNHQFCGKMIPDAQENCSQETHCYTNADCPVGQACWNNLEFPCDIREFLPVEEGGNVGRGEGPGKMSQKEIAESMGLVYPSENPADHYFCGESLQEIGYKCKRMKPCPSGSSESCDHGHLCFQDTPCDARIRDDYGLTKDPTPSPTSAPIDRDDPINSRFCGVDWGHANGCRTQWCPTGMGCPPGESCFEHTDCNIRDRGPIRPTRTPTWAPVKYDDAMNYQFCGKSFLDASEKCSQKTHCKTGKHEECGPGMFCWPGVPCNVVDLNPPTTARPTTNTYAPTKSPMEYDDPANYKFCGETWSDASTCGKNKWCPTGMECPDGQMCFADTMCHIMEFTFSPTNEPTGNPTNATTYPPSKAPIPFDHPSHTRFCGKSVMEAKCSIESHCPSGTQSECPSGEYCWVGVMDGNVPCNILNLLPPSPPPTPRPTNSPTLEFWPSQTPSTSPSTATPSMSPLPLDDIRQFFYCGYSWDDASSKCKNRCPDSTTKNCPNGESCFSNTACPAVSSNSKPKITPQPTKQPNVQSTMAPSSSSLETLQPVTVSPLSLAPTTAPPTTIPTDSPLSIRNPQTEPPMTSAPIEIQSVIPPTRSPEKDMLTFPFVPENMVSKPSQNNIDRIEFIVNSVQSSLENEVFVIQTRSGSTFPSTLYTFGGFRAGLLFHSTVGVSNNYFYLGEEPTSEESRGIEIEYGIANLALFLSKMMTNVIAYESCEPNRLACGLFALDTSFQDQDVRIMCSSTSDDAGMECVDESIGCACILGILDHQLGAIEFCTSDPYKSICNRDLNQGEELRWITAMTYWSYFVQEYNTGDWIYIKKLRDFVRDGMVDTSFIEIVGGLSALNEEVTIQQRFTAPPIDSYVSNFYKIMVILSDGIASQPKPSNAPMKASTSKPSFTPILLNRPSNKPSQLLSRTPSNSPSQSPSYPPTKLEVLYVPIPTQLPTDNLLDEKSRLSSIPTKRDVSSNIPSESPSYESGSRPENPLDQLCYDTCFVPVSMKECPSQDRYLNLNDCLQIGRNELCQATGECGTNAALNNCGVGMNIYRRIDCSTAGESHIEINNDFSLPPSASNYDHYAEEGTRDEITYSPSNAPTLSESNPPSSAPSIAAPQNFDDKLWFKTYWIDSSATVLDAQNCFSWCILYWSLLLFLIVFSLL